MPAKGFGIGKRRYLHCTSRNLRARKSLTAGWSTIQITGTPSSSLLTANATRLVTVYILSQVNSTLGFPVRNKTRTVRYPNVNSTLPFSQLNGAESWRTSIRPKLPEGNKRTCLLKPVMRVLRCDCGELPLQKQRNSTAEQKYEEDGAIQERLSGFLQEDKPTK